MQRPFLAVQSDKRFAWCRSLDFQRAAGDRIGVESMERVPEFEHHVVGDIDHVGDRSDANLVKAQSHRQGCLAECDPRDLTGDETPTADLV